MVFEVGDVDYELADVDVDGCRTLLLEKLVTAVAHTLNREYFFHLYFIVL